MIGAKALREAEPLVLVVDALHLYSFTSYASLDCLIAMLSRCSSCISRLYQQA